MEIDPHDFFARAWTALDHQLGGAFSFPVGDLRVAVEHPGSEDWTHALTRTLCGVSSETNLSELRIRVFGGPQIAAMPAFPVALAASARGRIEAWCTADFLAVSHQSALCLADRQTSRAVLYHGSPALIPPWDLCAPFRMPLGFLLAPLGFHLLHGAAVGLKGLGCLLAGKGGSGKSSSALTALSPSSRLGFLGEDYMLVREADLMAYPLYRSFKVDPLGLQRMPWLRAFSAISEQDGKSCRQIPETHVSAPVKLARLVWPDRESDRPIASIASTTALLKLAPSTLFQNPNASSTDLKALASLCRRLQSFKMGLAGSPSPAEVESRLLHLIVTSNEVTS